MKKKTIKRLAAILIPIGIMIGAVWLLIKVVAGNALRGLAQTGNAPTSAGGAAAGVPEGTTGTNPAEGGDGNLYWGPDAVWEWLGYGEDDRSTG